MIVTILTMIKIITDVSRFIYFAILDYLLLFCVHLSESARI